MHQYDFEKIIDRKGTGAIKMDMLEELYGSSDLIPLWVADMDFETGDFITEALIERCKHSVFGYTSASESYYNSIIGWVKKHHQWEIEKDWLSYIPGIVKGIAFCIDKFTKPGDKIIIQPPVYHPFRLIPQAHHREIIENPLIEENGKYRMDLDGLRKQIDKDCRILILCNPQNPIGITWPKETLKELADICLENNIFVISDEIHADMGIFGHKHIPFATVSENAANNSITFMAPSKTFNIAGIVSSYSIISNEQIRKEFYDYLEASELESGTIFAYVATQAAYEKGYEWMLQVLQYIENNILFVDKYLKENIPSITAIIPEASFLVWLDCRKLKFTQKELIDLFVKKAGLALNDGEIFGKEGIGFMRLNVGTSRIILEKALNRLKKALE